MSAPRDAVREGDDAAVCPKTVVSIGRRFLFMCASESLVQTSDLVGHAREFCSEYGYRRVD